MAEPLVRFDGVWKKFNRGQRFNSIRDLVPEMAAAFFRRRHEDQLQNQQFWALQDVSFEVGPGQALGIIGPNGAGKSTALKILTKILRPERGQSLVRGRVGALVEIAAGFHPDLTGRENVLMQGAIMGMGRAEVLRKFDDIVDFAGVRDFIDTPVKRYSSGMNARLGFAVAAHLDPDVLIIDEVLSVGDLSFQEKCFERMQRFVSSGIPMVFVSHNLAAVSQLCDRVMVLRSGRVEALTTTQEAIALYARLTTEAQSVDFDRNEVTVTVHDASGAPVTEINGGDRITVRVRAFPKGGGRRLKTELRIRHLQSSALIYRGDSHALGAGYIDVPSGGGFETTWSLTANLGRGHYGLYCEVLGEGRGWVARSAPSMLSVHEDQSVRAIVFLDGQCSARPLELIPVAAT